MPTTHKRTRAAGGRGETARPGRSRPGAASGSLVERLLARDWPAAAWAVALAALVLLAAGLRLAFQARVAQTPLAEGLTADSQVYWRWAGHILQYGWAGRSLWFFGPLYAYALALLRPPTASSIPAILAIQALWGAAATGLLADAARRLSRPAVGLLTGLLVAAYPMAILFDGLVLMESLLFALQALLLWWIVRTGWDRAGIAAGAVLGALVGLLVLGRGTALVLLLPALALLVPWRRRGPAALACAGGMLAGLALLVGPVAVRNYRVSGAFVPITYNFGFNLWVGQGPRATGTWVSVESSHGGNDAAASSAEGGVEADGREVLRKTLGLDLGPAESSRHFSDLALREVRAHPARAAKLEARKLVMAWNRREYPQIENLDEFTEVAGAPGWPWLGGFAVLGALGIAGLPGAWRHGRSGRFLVFATLVSTGAMSLFFITDRYRLHLVPPATLLAALFLEDAWRARRGPARAALPVAAAAILGAALVCLPAPALTRADLRAGVASDLGGRWLQRGRPDLAAREFERAERLDASARRGGGLGPEERSKLHFNYGVALEQTGHASEAASWFERALRDDPGNVNALRGLAGAWAAAGRTREADSLLARLNALPGGGARAAAGRGWEAARAGRYDEAEREFAEAVRMDSHLFNEWAALVRLQIQAKRLAAADSTLTLARDAGMPRPTARAHEALIAAMRGRRMEAEAALADVPVQAEASDPTVADVVRMARAVLRQR